MDEQSQFSLSSHRSLANHNFIKLTMNMFHLHLKVYSFLNFLKPEQLFLNFFTFTLMHLAEAFIQSDIQCIEGIHFINP